MIHTFKRQTDGQQTCSFTVWRIRRPSWPAQCRADFPDHRGKHRNGSAIQRGPVMQPPICLSGEIDGVGIRVENNKIVFRDDTSP